MCCLLKNNCSLRAERRRREERREKCTHENCTLPTIHLGPAGRRPSLGLVRIKLENNPNNDKNKDILI